MSISTFERASLLTHAKSIVATAKAANRDLNDAEAEQVECDLTKIKALDASTKTPNLVQRVMGLATSEDFNEDGSARGGFFTDEVKTGVIGAIKSRQSFRAELPAKAALTSGGLLPTSGSAVQGGLHPNSQFPIASLFNNLPADGPSQRYYRFTSGTAAVVAEAALKPDAGVGITAVDLVLAKIAATAQFSDEMADDAPFLVSHLQLELSAAVLAAENAAILGTFGTTSGVLTGTSTAATVIDLLADSIASAEAISGITPVAVIAHPSVVATIRKVKASTAGSYMVDPLTSGPTLIHGVQLISSPATAAGTAWVVEASGTVIYRRGGLTVEVGTNADDWTKNLRTMRAEERMGTAVLRPSSLTRLTLT